MDIEFGNAGAIDTGGTGWFIGFSDWMKTDGTGMADLRLMAEQSLSRSLQMKWMAHPTGDDRGTAKPLSVGRTISILVSESGEFRLEFSTDRDFPAETTVRYILEKHGDFVAWGENLYHRWFVDRSCTILTLRWTPVETS